MPKVIISADSNCDIGPVLQERYDIKLFNWSIELDGKTYIDSVDIFPDDLYRAWRERKVLPKSSAASPLAIAEHFAPWREQGYEIVHLNLGSGLSATHENCLAVAEQMGGVHVVDSQNLSTGFGHLVIQAAKLARQGLGAAEIKERVEAMCPRAHASFLLDTLEFMQAGGRCSNMAAIAASAFKIKPCIEVENQNGGRMHAAKKYHGAMEVCLKRYVHDKLAERDDLDTGLLFITHSGSPQSDIDLVREEVALYQRFDEIIVTRASCVISTHCGPRTLGILFMTEEDVN
jgi:DegV family protein with EDD domain